MGELDGAEERLWEAGWEAHALGQRRRLARLSMVEKLRWLEEAQRLVGHLERERVRRGDPEPRRK